MAVQFVTYEDSTLQAGKFYEIRVNKDLASAVVEVPMQTMEDVVDMTLYETDGDYNTPIRALKKINTSFGEGHVPVDITPMYLPNNKIQIMFNPPFTGVIIKN